jgi:hypothetical protein
MGLFNKENNSTENQFVNMLNNAKTLITGVVILVTSVIGGYNLAGEYFITKAHAAELISEVSKELNELKKQTKDNKRILTEMRLIRIENKIYNNEKLTPTEDRIYQKLKKEYETFQ